MAIIFPNTQISSNSGQMQFDGFFRSVPTDVPAFLVQNDQNANLTTSNGRPITWDQTVYDHGNNMGSTTFTCPLAGIYWFYTWMMDSNGGNNINDYYDVRVNGSIAFGTGFRVYSSGASSHHHQFPGGGIVTLEYGDTVDVYIGRMDTGLYGNDHHYTMFQGCYLGRQ
jgi:hypothetical protein